MSSIQQFLEDHRRGVTIAVTAAAALLVLVAVLLIGGVLRLSTGIAGGSPSPSPSEPLVSVEPSTTAPPSPPSASPTPAPAVAYDAPFGATVLVDSLNVREEPGTGAVVATLAKDAEVLFDARAPETIDGADWWAIQFGAQDSGYVSAGPPDAPYLNIHRYIDAWGTAAVEGVTSGQPGYLAWGTSPAQRSAAPHRFVAVSTDGQTWTLGELPAETSDASHVSVAHGPVGWLLVAANPDNSGWGIAMRSDDGLSWQALGGALEAGIAPVNVVGSANGYVLSARDDRTGTSQGRLFFSPDGLSWKEVQSTASYSMTVDRLGDGFLAWAERPEVGTYVGYSADGEHWMDTTGGGTRSMLSGTPTIAGAGNRLIAVSSVNDDTGTHSWWWTAPAPTPSRPEIDWSRLPAAESALDDVVVGALVSFDEGVLLVGSGMADGSAQVWETRDGVTWNGPITDVPPISASRETLAVGTSGLVGFADEITAAGGNPVFWLTADGEGWTRESSPAIPATVHAVVGGCPTVPATMMEWLAIPGSVGAECFGEESITFTAWNTVGGGCGGYAPGIFEPGWLASPFAEFAIILTPFEAEYGGCGSATVHPDAGTLPDPQQWIQITGHWDDPASEQCRVLPDPQIRAPQGASLTFECSARFVVTGATEVDGP